MKIWSGVDIDHFARPVPAGELSRFRHLHGLHGDPILGAICRLSPVKGLDTFLKAVPALLPRFPNLQVLLVGDGPSREELVRLAYALKIEDRVVMVHSVEDTRVPLAALQVFIAPAHREGFGLSIVEAMAAGVPVVSSHEGGPATLLEQGKSGLLVPPKDPQALHKALETLLADSALRTRMAQAARARAREKYDMKRVVREVERVYRNRILIVSVNWMGDLLFLTPAIRAIRRAHPDAFLACLASPRGVDLLRGNPHLNEVIPIEETRGPGNLRVWWGMIGRLRAGRFDTAFLFHRSFTRALAVRWAGIPERIGQSTWKRNGLLTTAVDLPAPDSVHKIDAFLRIVEAAGIRPDGRHYDAGILPEDRAAADRLMREMDLDSGQRVVALHAGANWRLKRWPPKNFARLADELADRYRAKVLFVGGEGDRVLLQGILGRMKSRPAVAAGRATFRQTGALLERSSLLISNDSGPLHLGLAVGVPVVALFGPTDPNLTGPADGSRSVTPPPGLSAKGGCFQETWPAGPKTGGGVTLLGSIGCPIPCYQLRCPANLCMEQITVEQVLEAAGPLLEGSDPFRAKGV